MKPRSLKYTILIFCLLISFDAFSQQLTASDTSEKSVRHYQSIIKNNRQLVNFIEYTFRSRGVPKHMRNLAIIESGLDHQIVSHAGAKGMWQFMVDHANEYGLSDEDRSDMYKSTKTAAVSLINLYNKYGNWITVVAAYNCGEGNIQKAMNKAGSKKYTDFDAYLPLETQNHVKKFLNACYATGELDQVLSNYYKTPTPAKKVATKAKPVAKTEKISKAKTSNLVIKDGLSDTTINAAYDLDVIADFFKISKTEILNWNPNIEKNLLEKGESQFFLPDNMMIEFKINKNKLLNSSLKK